MAVILPNDSTPVRTSGLIYIWNESKTWLTVIGAGADAPASVIMVNVARNRVHMIYNNGEMTHGLVFTNSTTGQDLAHLNVGDTYQDFLGYLAVIQAPNG